MGLPLRLPPVQPRSRLAHESAKWAESQNRLEEYIIALFRAFFQFGQDIGKKEVLCQLAIDLGLDPAGLATSLEEGKYTTRVLADQAEAKRIGVNAVPAYVVHDRIVATGVQTVKALTELLRALPG